MKSFYEIMQILEFADYSGEHQAPTKENGAPMYDLTDVYPEDIYSINGVRYYGDGRSIDANSIAIINSARGNPNLKVQIYRAVPKIITKQDHIDDLMKQKAYIMKHGRIPPNISTNRDPSSYYELISNTIETLAKQPESDSNKITINPGDWVTISRPYAVGHGQSSLGNNYKIITKKVPAKHLFTDGNSIHEWGYDPT